MPLEGRAFPREYEDLALEIPYGAWGMICAAWDAAASYYHTDSVSGWDVLYEWISGRDPAPAPREASSVEALEDEVALGGGARVPEVPPPVVAVEGGVRAPEVPPPVVEEGSPEVPPSVAAWEGARAPEVEEEG